MKTIALSQNQITIVDDKDFDLLNKWKWYAHKDITTGNFYATRTDRSNGIQRTIKLHRFLLNPPDDLKVDHKNGNTLDNQRINLRLASDLENARNAKVRKDSSSGYKGVYRQNNKWKVMIQASKRRVLVGYFKDLIQAAKAYDSKAKELFGEFAKLNFN